MSDELATILEELERAVALLGQHDEQKRLIVSLKNQKIRELEDQLSQMRSACVAAAQTAELACNRLVQYQPVIDAAREAVSGGSLFKLIQAVGTLNATKPS